MIKSKNKKKPTFVREYQLSEVESWKPELFADGAIPSELLEFLKEKLIEATAVQRWYDIGHVSDVRINGEPIPREPNSLDLPTSVRRYCPNNDLSDALAGAVVPPSRSPLFVFDYPSWI